MQIRTAQYSDAALVAEFNTRLAQETENLALNPSVIQSGVAAVLEDPAKGVYYLAEVDGVVAGQLMITYEWSDWRNGNIWWIQSVYVHPGRRRQGVFTALFHHVIQLARGQPEVCQVRLYMHRENATARRCYESLGMSRTAYEVFELDTRPD